MAVMFITHDLGVVAEIADNVLVMYLGNVMEFGSVHDIFDDPKHPYTQALLRSIPRMGLGGDTRLETIEGMVPSPFRRPEGCPFHTRCTQRIPGVCEKIRPRRKQWRRGERSTACYTVTYPSSLVLREG